MSQTEPTPSVRMMPQQGNFVRVIAPLLLAAVIFVCGGAAGWGVATFWHGPRPPMGPGFGPEPPIDEMVDRLSHELLLSDQQVGQVRAIYEQRRDALEELRHQMDPQFKAEFDKLDEQMKAVLNERQYQAWSQRFKNAIDQNFPHHHGPGGPGMGPGGPGGPGMGPGGPGPGFGPGGPGGPGPDGHPNGHGPMGPGGPMGGPPGMPPPGGG